VSGIIKTFEYGGRTVSIETGIIARQATGAVVINIDGTVVLVTVVGVKEAGESKGFFPLSVHYQERTYAAGRIPGSFFKREGRPSEIETLISRLIDRPLRPLFPEGFQNEVQILATVLSVNPEVSADIPAIIGASAALAISGIPFHGPVGAARVGYINGQYVLNPSLKQLADSSLDLVVAGTRQGVLMVESEAKELPEAIMLGAVKFGHQHMQVPIQVIEELAAEAGKTKWEWQAPPVNSTLLQQVTALVEADIIAAYSIPEKQARQSAIEVARNKALTLVNDTDPTANPVITAKQVTSIFENAEYRIVRHQIITGKPRIDGRDTKTVRPIYIDVGILPRVHGSALFTRGETQALVVATLGTDKDAQTIDAIDGERKEPFMLHYNFPPYSVGEVGMVGSPKRREIGHGRLAKRSIQAVIPNAESFPYVLRVVSEITESNGSSSMASVCGTSLALMDAGVPIKAPVAGIAMGLIKEDDHFAVLTDILGDEDHLGDMDFKVAGTSQGITALQMDIKIQSITEEIMRVALDQAKDGRLHILGIMNQVLPSPRQSVSEFAPRVITLRIPSDKVRDVIGKGGVTIRALTEETGATIDINDEGVIKIASVNREAGEEAKRRIELITADAEVGRIYDGTVVRIVEFGAFVNFLPGKDGLVHISQISEERIENVNDVLQEGQVIKVKVLEVDRQGRIRLSIKEVEKTPV